MALAEKSSSKSPEKEEESSDFAGNKTRQRFFLKYASGLVDLCGEEGKWWLIKSEDLMLSLECIKCGDVVLMRKDGDHICTYCKSKIAMN